MFRSRVVDPRWIAAMRKHGYQGAFELAATVDYLFGFDTTAGVVPDWMYATQRLEPDDAARGLVPGRQHPEQGLEKVGFRTPTTPWPFDKLRERPWCLELSASRRG